MRAGNKKGKSFLCDPISRKDYDNFLMRERNVNFVSRKLSLIFTGITAVCVVFCLPMLILRDFRTLHIFNLR